MNPPNDPNNPPPPYPSQGSYPPPSQGAYPPPPMGGYPPQSYSQAPSGIGEFLSFRKMLTPVIIQVIFWVGVAASIIAGLITMIGGLAASHAASEFGGGGGVPGGFLVIGGLLEMVVGSLLTRIWCELIILSFRIYETLVEIRDKR